MRPGTRRSSRVAACVVGALALALAGGIGPRGPGVPSVMAQIVSPDDPGFAPIRDVLIGLGMTSSQVAEVMGVSVEDVVGDWFHPTGEAPGQTPNEIDFIVGAVFELHLGPEDRARLGGPGGLLACDGDGVVCGEDAGDELDEEYYVYVGSVVDPFVPDDGSRAEFGIIGLDPTPEGGGAALPWQPNPQFPGDFFQKGNLAWFTRWDRGNPAISGRLLYTGGQGFDPLESGARTLTLGRSISTYVPADEWGDIEMARAFSFLALGGVPLPQTSAADTVTDLDQPMWDVRAPLSIDLGAAAAPSPSTSPPTTVSSPSVAATSSTVTPAPTTSPGSVPVATTGSPPWILFIVGGGLLAALGAWLLTRGRAPAAPAGADAAADGRPPVVAAPVVVATSADPCAELKAAAAAARSACEEAQRAAREARAAADRAKVEVEAARQAADRARQAREAAEREVELRSQAPDPGTDFAETTIDGRPLRIDEYDRMLRERAFKEAADRYRDQVANAGPDADTGQMARDHADELRDIGDPEAIHKLREADAREREQRLREAQEALARARDADAPANEAATKAADASAAADEAAAGADRHAADVCAKADAAEEAYRACAGAGAAAAGAAALKGSGHDLEFDDGSPGSIELTHEKGRSVHVDDDGVPIDDRDTPPPPAPTAGGGGSAQEAPQAECQPGDEKWEYEGDAAVFVVPVPGAKIRVVSEPAQERLTEWLENWRTFDADGNALPEPEEERGVPPDTFKRQGVDRMRDLFGGLEKKARQVKITITLPLQEVRVRCQRRYVCENGHWVRTNQKRVYEWDPEPKPRELVVEGPNLFVNDVSRLWTLATTAWAAAEKADNELFSRRHACERG